MTASPEKFHHLMLAHRADGKPLELSRLPGEIVFVAFNERIKRLVELHILQGAAASDPASRRSSLERAMQAAELRGPGFIHVLEAGEDDGIIYYTSALNDGEFVDDYISRRGALPPATAFCLLAQLLDDLVQLQSYHRLISRLSLGRLLVTTLEDAFLQLRIIDFGLGERESRSDGELRRLSAEVCELIFLLLTGKTYSGENPDRYPALTCLPAGLRLVLRSSLGDPANAPASLDKLRNDVKEAFAAVVSNLQIRNTRKHLVVSHANLLPASQLQNLLLENAPVDDLLHGRFVQETAEGSLRHPFSIPVLSAKDSRPLTVHLLPPARIVPKDGYEAVPPQMWRFDPHKHPNILRSLSLWESPDWTFLTEERQSGFPLSRLIAERIALNPAEVLCLLKETLAGIDQALECGVSRLDLHPSNMLLQAGKGGPLQAREFDKLMLKRVDSWPALRLKLRPHLTMRSLYEPLLVDDPDDAASQEPRLRDKDFLSRSFVALAAYLLTGARQLGRTVEFPETVPAALAKFIRESLANALSFGTTPQPGEFVQRFEQLMSGASEGALSASAIGGSRVDASRLESVGAVSDFENEWNASPSCQAPAAAKAAASVRPKLARHPPIERVPLLRRGVAGMVIWTAVTLLIGLVLLSFFFGKTDPAAAGGSSPAALGATGLQPPGKPAAEPSAARKVLIMIRKAIIPTREEVEQFRVEQARERAATSESEAANGGLAEREPPGR